jgi:hypothetical protein
MTHWVRHRAPEQPVSMPPEHFSTRPLVEAVTLRLQVSREGASTEFLRVPPARSFRRAPAYQGSRPSSRHHRSASTYRGGSQASATFRPRAFSAPRRFAPRPDCVGLFHPTTTCRVDGPSRGFSPRAVPPSFRRALPPCRSTPGTHRPEAGCHTQAPRLRGFLPHEAALCRPRGLAAHPPRSPLRVLASSRSSSLAVTTACAAASALDVAGLGLRFRARPVQPTSAYCRRPSWPIHL